MSRPTEKSSHAIAQNLLKAVKTVLGENANNRPTLEELENLHEAAHEFEQALRNGDIKGRAKQDDWLEIFVPAAGQAVHNERANNEPF